MVVIAAFKVRWFVKRESKPTFIQYGIQANTVVFFVEVSTIVILRQERTERTNHYTIKQGKTIIKINHSCCVLGVNKLTVSCVLDLYNKNSDLSFNIKALLIEIFQQGL
jgi:hypothetical protein